MSQVAGIGITAPLQSLHAVCCGDLRRQSVVHHVCMRVLVKVIDRHQPYTTSCTHTDMTHACVSTRSLTSSSHIHTQAQARSQSSARNNAGQRHGHSHGSQHAQANVPVQTYSGTHWTEDTQSVLQEPLWRRTPLHVPSAIVYSTAA